MKDLTDKEFFKLRDYIKDNFGISLNNDKKSLVFSRLRAIVQEKGFNDFSEYYDYLVSDKSGEAVIRFIDKITTNHTFFMREIDHFDYFRDTVLPYIEKTYGAKKDLRLWCAGCSSGEEPYTLQMIIQDYFKSKAEKWDTQMLATDISTIVLDKAVAGVYAEDSVKSLPKQWQSEYFTKMKPDNMVVQDVLKKNIIFRKFNLMEEKFPFKQPFQVIFCRNVMIYFDNDTRNKLVNKFYDLTEKGGYFFIGHSESLSHSDSGYKYIMPAVYRKE